MSREQLLENLPALRGNSPQPVFGKERDPSVAPGMSHAEISA
jgi:hypothetical protein